MPNKVRGNNATKKRKLVRYEIPAGVDPTHCRGCGAPTFWVMTIAGIPVLLNPDGTNHLATCPKADGFRNKKPAPVAQKKGA